MEKLKPLLSNLKAQGFWIFCGVALIACVTVYFMTNGKLDAEAKQASAKQMAALHIKFPSGLIRGALSGLGVVASVSAEVSEMPRCQFTIKISS